MKHINLQRRSDITDGLSKVSHTGYSKKSTVSEHNFQTVSSIQLKSHNIQSISVNLSSVIKSSTDQQLLQNLPFYWKWLIKRRKMTQILYYHSIVILDLKRWKEGGGKRWVFPLVLTNILQNKKWQSPQTTKQGKVHKLMKTISALKASSSKYFKISPQ